MTHTRILGTGHYVPEKVVTNDDLSKIIDTSDEWIRQRTGIEERRHVDWENDPMGSSEMATRAARAAIADAGLEPKDVDFIVYATLSPDKGFPGDGVLVQANLDIPAGVPALDIRNQCSGFLYGLSVVDAFVKNGTYKNVLLIGAETHSSGLDFTDAGRDITVLFGDGAAAMMLGPTEDPDKGILSIKVHADGRFADELHVSYPSSSEFPRVSVEGLERGALWPQMNGRTVFKHASLRMPEVIMEVLEEQNLKPKDIDLLVPHQANLRINEMVQKRLELSDDQVFNNIMKYGNTTAASIPLAFDQARKLGRANEGALVCFAAFGSGFTWGSALVRM